MKIKLYEIKVIISILVLLLFISAHHLLPIWYETFYHYVLFWMDLFFYLAIILQLILILWIIRDVINDGRKEG